MPNVLNLLNQGWLGTLLGLLGLGFGIYQLRRRTTGKLVYQGRGVRLIGHSSTLPPDVQVVYKGDVVPRLSSRRIIIWNDGRSPIRGNDISSSDPLRFAFEEGAVILDADIVKRTRDANDLRIEKNDNELCIAFDFLNPGDGAVIEILHTGARTYAEALGTIVGQPEGPISYGLLPPYDFDVQVTASAYPPLERLARVVFRILFGPVGKLFLGTVTLVGLATLAYAIFPAPIVRVLSPAIASVRLPAASERVTLGLLGTLYSVAALPVWSPYRRRYPRALLLKTEKPPAEKTRPKPNQ